MPKTPDRRSTANGQYRIAAVSKLTGMPVPTIRMWERRYEVVTPARSAANGRLYSRADIERLTLLKAAVDAGHAIGTVAALEDEQIRERLRQSSALPPAPAHGECRVLACGGGLGDRLQKAWSGRHDVRLVAALPTLESPLPAQERYDAVVVQLPSLQVAVIPALRQLRASLQAPVMIVLHGFGSRQALTRLDQDGILALSLPVDPAQLARLCRPLRASGGVDAAGDGETPVPARRYDEHFLATVARLPTTVRCECPNHLADLLTKLNGFEQYSLECESSDPADASVHAMLYRAAAQCRQTLEGALQRVLEHEGIRTPSA